MSEKYFRIFFGSLIIFVLYFDLNYVMYGMIACLVFEGVTNLRLTLILSRIRFGNLNYVNVNKGWKINFDAERMWRFGVALSLFLTYVVFAEVMWFFPWFIGFMLIIAGVTNLCALVMFFNWIGFKNVRPAACFDQVDRKKNVSDDWTRNWDVSIAVRITSIILWILTALVSFSAAFMYNHYKHDLEEEIIISSENVQFHVGHLVNLEGALSSEVLASEFNETFFKKYKLAAIEVNEGNQSYHFENHLVAAGDYFRVEKSVPFRDRSGVETSVDLKLFFPAIKEQIIKQRKNVLVLMAIGVMLFGVLIERIITLFLHHPISSLVRATNRVSEGNMNFRLETDRTDEFGELSRFFNQMLDQILEDQTFVKNTLAYITAIIDHMADALIVMDINGIITHANPSFYKMFGKKRNEIIGSNIENIHYLLNIKDMKKISGDSPGEIFEGEVQLKDNRIGKSIATTVVDSINYQDAEGTAPGMIIIIRDVTNEKEADKMKTDFLSIVSHELRTPLTSVVGFSKVIKRKLNREIFPFMENINEETKKSMRQVKTDVDIIVSEGNRLTSLINDVLDIAKMEAGKTEWKMKAMDISEAMLRAKTVTLPLIENKNIEILCEFENDLPLVMGDHDKIVQVLINLLSNAIKFTDSGKITCKIFKRDDQKMQVSVKDEGIGIAPSDQPLIFEKFKQSGYILTDRPRGTGLGLPICKHIIQQHAGEIWVESVPAEGSVFSFTIPFLQEEERNIEFKNFDIFMERMELLFPFSGKTGKKDILIIDDQHTMRTNLKNEFEKYGCLVRYAGTVFEAINDLQKGKPDLILIFIKMPLINAIEASVLLEENKESENIPFAILTAREDHHETLLGLNRYFSRSFSKEFLESELIGFSDSFRNKNAMILEENGFPEENLEEMLQNAGFSEVILCRSDEIIKKACSRKPDIIFSSKKSINQNHIFDILRYDPSIGDSIFLIMDR